MPNGPIQTFPRGLLALLNLKNRGQNPTDLAQTLAPTVDLTRLYLEDQVKVLHVSVPLVDNVVGSFTIGGPGETEMWWVSEFSIKLLIGVPSTAGYVTRVRPSVLVNPLQVMDSYQGPLVEFIEDGLSRSNYYFVAPVWQNLIIPPGGEAGYWVEKCQIGSGADITLQATVRYAPLLI